VRKAGSRVRITAQLINAADGYHVWSENYDRDLTDIFEVQDEISSIIANKLRENLSSDAKKEHLVKTSVQNIEAYTLYLKARHFWNKLTPADTRKAIEFLEEAIKIEPDYAQAYAMIASAYAFLGATGQIKPEKAFPIVREYSDKALKLDSTIAESHIAKASVHLFFDPDPKIVQESLQKAIQLNPAAAEAYELMGFYYIMSGRKAEAVSILEKALEIDPLSPVINHNLAEAYLMAERYDDAYGLATKLVEMNPEMRASIETQGWCVGLKGDWEKAKEFFLEVHRLTNHPLKGLGPLGFAYAKLGEREKALEIIAKMVLRQEQEPDSVIDGDLLMVWWGLGDRDKSYYYLQQCVEKKMGVQYFLQYPPMKGIDDDPRVAELFKNVNISRH
jgi:adenylate cyclase